MFRHLKYFNRSTIDNIKVEYDYDTIKSDPKYLNLYHINAKCIEKLEICPDCGAGMRGNGLRTRTILECIRDSVEHKENPFEVILTRRQYVCTNPACKKSIVAGMSLTSKKYTKNFAKYIVTRLLEDAELSYKKLSNLLPVSHTQITNIVKEYANSLSLQFCPQKDIYCFYIHSFMYNQRKWYYFAGQTIGKPPVVLSFFGYKDADWELENYMILHWNRSNSLNVKICYVDKDIILSDKVKDCLTSAMCFPPNMEIDSIIEKYRVDFGNGTFTDICKQLDELKLLLSNSAVTFFEWQRKFQKTALYKSNPQHFICLLEELNNVENIEIGYEKFSDEYRKINRRIEACARKHIPFEMMCLKQLYRDHGDIIFSTPDPQNNIYNEERNLYYLTPRPAHDMIAFEQEGVDSIDIYYENDQICEELNKKLGELQLEDFY